VGKESALADDAAAAWLYQQLSPRDRQHMARLLKKLLAVLGAEALGVTTANGSGRKTR
jgi:hypothetical protein